MLDRAISSFVPLIFNELPETAAEFNGFIWYPNTATYNGHTMMGSPPLYGGYEYTPEKINARDDEPLVKTQRSAVCYAAPFCRKRLFRNYNGCLMGKLQLGTGQ